MNKPIPWQFRRAQRNREELNRKFYEQHADAIRAVAIRDTADLLGRSKKPKAKRAEVIA